MPHNDMQDSDLENSENSPPTPSQEGYAISIHVTSEGYHITGPDPLPEDMEPHDHVDLTTALKTVLAIVKENPVTDDAYEQMKAGYESA